MLTAFWSSCGLALQKMPAYPAPQRWAALLPALRAQRLRPIAYWVARQTDLNDHLVYLCHHAWLHHGLQKSLGLVDVCLLLRKVEADGTDESVLQREDIGAARRGLWYFLQQCLSASRNADGLGVCQGASHQVP